MGRSKAAISSKLNSLPADEKPWLPGAMQPGQHSEGSADFEHEKIDHLSETNPGGTPLKVENEPGELTKLRAQGEHWKKEATRLSGELAKRRGEQTAVDILVEQAKELAPRSYSAVTPLPSHEIAPHQNPQSALLMFSDTHVGQVVEPDQTLGHGGYNFELFLRRLARLERSITSILKDHTTTAVPEIVVAMLGDQIDGALSHGAECGQVNTLFDQFYGAGHAFAQFFRNLSRLAPVRIHTCVGNHPRWGTQHKMPTKNRYSNLDLFLYAYTAALTRDVDRITWNINKQPFAEFEIQGFRFYASHGDELRGGDKALGIPNHAVGRRVSATGQMRAMSGQKPVNYFLHGHLHRPIELPHACGEVLVNGGFPGIDGFGLSAGFTPSRPSQKFTLIHARYGRSAAYDIRLDFGDSEPHQYTLPEGFKCI